MPILNKDPYALDKKTKRMVDVAIDDYYFTLERKAKLDKEIEKYDYETLKVTKYDSIVVSRTNAIYRAAENAAIDITDKRRERDELKVKVDAIDRGIARAANTSFRLDRVEALRLDLISNMLNKTPRYAFDRDSRTMANYRKKAYYFIAEELGYVKPRYPYPNE